MGKEWRVIFDSRYQATYNMAVDEAMLRACAAKNSPPTIRIYGWEKPSISLGFFQDLGKSGINLKHCEENGIKIVRRITGGKAVLHGHDITFAIALPESEISFECNGILGSHHWLMNGIKEGLSLLGISTELGSASESLKAERSNPDCFAHIAECDLRMGKVKLAGAAQVRKWGGLLEQGSLPHSTPLVDLGKVFRLKSTQHSANPLENIPRNKIAEALIRGFEEALGIETTRSELSVLESELASELEAQKYALDDWTFRKGVTNIDNNNLDCYTDTASLRGGR